MKKIVKDDNTSFKRATVICLVSAVLYVLIRILFAKDNMSGTLQALYTVKTTLAVCIGIALCAFLISLCFIKSKKNAAHLREKLAAAVLICSFGCMRITQPFDLSVQGVTMIVSYVLFFAGLMLLTALDWYPLSVLIAVIASVLYPGFAVTLLPVLCAALIFRAVYGNAGTYNVKINADSKKEKSRKATVMGVLLSLLLSVAGIIYYFLRSPKLSIVPFSRYFIVYLPFAAAWLSLCIYCAVKENSMKKAMWVCFSVLPAVIITLVSCSGFIANPEYCVILSAAAVMGLMLCLSELAPEGIFSRTLAKLFGNTAFYIFFLAYAAKMCAVLYTYFAILE